METIVRILRTTGRLLLKLFLKQKKCMLRFAVFRGPWLQSMHSTGWRRASTPAVRATSASHLWDDAILDQEGSDGDREKGLEWRDRSKNHQNCKFRD